MSQQAASGKSPAPGAGRRSGAIAKSACHVALRGKATGGGDLCQGLSIADQLFRALDPAGGNLGLGGHATALPKAALQVKLAQFNQAGQVAQINRLIQVGFDEFSQMPGLTL